MVEHDAGRPIRKISWLRYVTSMDREKHSHSNWLKGIQDELTLLSQVGWSCWVFSTQRLDSLFIFPLSYPSVLRYDLGVLPGDAIPSYSLSLSSLLSKIKFFMFQSDFAIRSFFLSGKKAISPWFLFICIGVLLDEGLFPKFHVEIFQILWKPLSFDRHYT